MRLNKKTIYTFNLLIYLNEHNNEYLKLTNLCDELDIAYEHLRVISKDLNKFDAIESKAGKNGGIKLKKDPSDIDIYPILLNAENLKDEDVCIDNCATCPNKQICPMSSFIQTKVNQLIKSFEGMTLEMLIEQS